MLDAVTYITAQIYPIPLRTSYGKNAGEENAVRSTAVPD